MTPYLRANRPARSQFTSPRRERPIGVIGVHTTESVMDTVGPDTGAENVASFIRGRTGPGSYHDIADSDSIVHLVAYEDESYHIATHTLNRRTTGLSFACKTSDWARMTPARRTAFLRNGARAAARQNAYHARHGRPVPAKRISLAQALAGHRGFLAHGDADPGRRTDPGTTPPHLFPWAEFLRYYAAEIGGTPAPTPPPAPKETFLMSLTANQQKQILKDSGDGKNLAMMAYNEARHARADAAAARLLGFQQQERMAELMAGVKIDRAEARKRDERLRTEIAKIDKACENDIASVEASLAS